MADRKQNIALCEKCGTRNATHVKRGRGGDFTPLCDECDGIRRPTPPDTGLDRREAFGMYDD